MNYDPLHWTDGPTGPPDDMEECSMKIDFRCRRCGEEFEAEWTKPDLEFGRSTIDHDSADGSQCSGFGVAIDPFPHVGYISGMHDDVTIYDCRLCGAVVTDPGVHADHHLIMGGPVNALRIIQRWLTFKTGDGPRDMEE